MPKGLLTTQQVARYLNVDKFTVYRLVAQKELPAFKVGNQWRYKAKILEAWLRKNMNISLRGRGGDHRGLKNGIPEDQ